MKAPFPSWRDVTDRDERIRQLEQLNSTLAAEIDKMRPIVEAAQYWNGCDYGSHQESRAAMRLSEVVNTYEAGKLK